MSHDHSHCGELFDRISSYLDGELAGRPCDELAAHLEGCEACRRYLESMRSTRDALNALGARPEVAGPECEALLQECLRTVLDRTRLRREYGPGGS